MATGPIADRAHAPRGAGFPACLKRGRPESLPHDFSAAAGEGLAFLAADLLVLVTDTLALVRLRLADGPHLGGELADLLLVGPLHDDGPLAAQFDRDALGGGLGDRVGVTDGQHD